VITVAGEALMDVVVAPSGAATAFAGGAPFNVARMIARLGGECQFLGRISGDRFGRRLRAELDRLGVRLAVPESTAAPTTLAIAELDDAGVAEYTFYLDGTSAAQLELHAIAPGILRDSRVIVFGGLGIVMEPIASTLRKLVANVPDAATVMLDANCRSGAIKDLDSYRRTVTKLLAHVDIVKVSNDDIRLLAPGVDPDAAARVLLERGPGAVLLTDGPAPVRIHTVSGERFVPVPHVRVVDTVGAGDAFVAAFVVARSTNSRERGRLDLDELARATAVAVRVATAACSVPGANLPDDVVCPGSEKSPASMALN
jgi:fructokinase